MIPLVLEESGGSERVFDIYSRLLRERIIFLGEQVTSDTANRIVAQLLFLEAEDPEKDIGIYKSSINKLEQAKELLEEIKIKEKKK